MHRLVEPSRTQFVADRGAAQQLGLLQLIIFGLRQGRQGQGVVAGGRLRLVGACKRRGRPCMAALAALTGVNPFFWRPDRMGTISSSLSHRTLSRR